MQFIKQVERLPSSLPIAVFFQAIKILHSNKPLGPSRVLNAYGIMSGNAFSRAMTIDEIKQTTTDFANAAKFSQKVGFDAIEIHMGHGYLLSQFLSPKDKQTKRPIRRFIAK